MDEKFYLLGMKQGGWLTKTGQYSSAITDAAKYDFPTAMQMARRHRTASNILVPVPVYVMEQL